MQRVLLVADDDGVAGVVAAVELDDVVDAAHRAGRWPCPCLRRPTGRRRSRLLAWGLPSIGGGLHPSLPGSPHAPSSRAASSTRASTIAAAAHALIERVEPNWVISTVASAAASASAVRPRALLAEQQHAALGQVGTTRRRRCPGTLSTAMTGSLRSGAQATKEATSGWCSTCW